MESIWKPKTRYFIKLPIEKMKERLDAILVEIMGYDPDKEWILEDVARCVKYLPNNEVAIDIQIRHKSLIESEGVMDWIDSEDFDLAKYMFQVDGFMSKEDYKSLNSININ